MSTIGSLFVLLLSFSIIVNGLTPTSFLTKADKDRIKSILDGAYVKGSKDVKTVSLVVSGYSLLERKYDHQKDSCELFQKVFTGSEDLDDLYYSSMGAFNLGDGICPLDKALLKNNLKDVSKVNSMEVLYKLVMSLFHLNQEIKGGLVSSVMDTLMKRDASAVNQAYSYMIASKIFNEKKDLKKYWVEVEDTLQQADEADGIHLYYDGGLHTTALIVNSIVDLSDKFGEAPSISRDKFVKLANFLLSRRQTYNIVASVQLTSALKSLARNKYVVPMVVSAFDNAVLDKQNPNLKISVTNLWGDQITNVQVVAETVKNVQTAVTVITRKSAVEGSLPGHYDLDLSSGKLDKGFYSIKLEIKSNDTRFSDVTVSSLVAKVTSDVNIEQVEISIKERDQITGALNYKLTMGSQLAEKLSINWHHRLEMKFTIKDDLQVFKPHQVFIRMNHVKTAQEIIFVVETDKSEAYKFVLDLEKSSKDFDNLSGSYEMQLIVGDAVIKSPLQWTFATIKLEMPGSPSTDNGAADSRRSVAGMKKSVAKNPRVGSGPSLAKEQIFHVFRPADKRAGDMIAIVFTVLCTVPPIVIMVVLWSMIGVNVSHFDLSLSSAAFHCGLALIFGLYYCYWSYLNMFTTLRYLVPLGAVTAFAGNRVLRQVASRRQKML